MADLLSLPTWPDSEQVHALVDTPRGSTCKLDLDRKLGLAHRLMG